MSESSNEATDRRGFLKLAGTSLVGGSAVAVGTLTGGAGAEAGEPAAEDKSGYRETSHVKTYYDLAREF